MQQDALWSVNSLGLYKTHITVYDTYSTELSGKGEYERERLNTLKCGTHRTLQIKLPAFMPTSKVIFYSTLHSSVGRQFKTFKTKIFWGFWAQNIIKVKREVRRIHWYTAVKEKTNDTKVIKDQTTAFFII